MENKKLKKSKIGRPKYQPNIELLQNLFKQVVEKTITNEEGWHIAKCKKTLWYKMKKLYNEELKENE